MLCPVDDCNVLVWETDSFRLFHNLNTGLTTTKFPDDTFCPCPVVPDDSIHGHELSITPERHRLEHELWHHLVGIYVLRLPYSPIIWREAHSVPHSPRYEEESGREEWIVTALSHALYGKVDRDHGVRRYLENEVGIDVERLLIVAREILSIVG
jgi:hypothetical protein